MPKYDTSFTPPASIALVTLRNITNGDEMNDVPMLIDSGADATLIPLHAVKHLGINLEDRQFELSAFDNSKSVSRVVRLTMLFANCQFKGDYMTVNEIYGVLGRNILNNLLVTLDGQNQMWDAKRV